MKRTWIIAALLLLAPVCVPRAPAHGGCSIHTITGTWGFGGDGKSLIADPTPDATNYHMAGLVLPGAFAGRFTVRRDGTFDGYYWLNIPGFPADLTPIPFGGPVKVSPDCTGEWSYDVPLPDGSTHTVVEKFAVVDQGREIRSMAWNTAIPTFTWSLVARRIPGRCTRGMAQGTYAMQCRGHQVVPGLPSPMPDPALLASTGLFRFEVDHRGNSSGRLMEKVGPGNVEANFRGTFVVEADCSVVMDVTVPGTGAVKGVGILVENTRRGYGLPMVLQPTEGEAVEMQAVYCEVVRMTSRSWRPCTGSRDCH